MSTAIQQYEGSYLTQWREPEEVLAEATKAAVALKRVVSMKKNPVMFNQEQYLEREDWGTVAKFYGCTAKSVSTNYVEFGNVRGFEAVAVVVDRNMNEIGRAESMCLSDEINWGEVPVYEWKDELDEHGKKIWDAKARGGKGGYRGKRVQTGTSPKPLFQLRSMAQTRAEAKALKGVFSWVVVLAGYQPTPAEEMIGNEQPRDDGDYVEQKTETKTEKKTPPVEDSISGVIEEAKPGKEGAVWVVIDKKLIVIEKKFYQETMVVGSTLSAKVQKRSSKKVGEFYAVLAVSEVKPPTEGEVIDAEVVDDGAPPVDDQKPIEGLQSLFDSGVVTTAE